MFNAKWIRAAGIRAVRTCAQTFLSLVSVGMAISEVEWKYVLSVTLLSGLLSIVTSLAGLPEVEDEE